MDELICVAIIILLLYLGFSDQIDEYFTEGQSKGRGKVMDDITDETDEEMEKRLADEKIKERGMKDAQLKGASLKPAKQSEKRSGPMDAINARETQAVHRVMDDLPEAQREQSVVQKATKYVQNNFGDLPMSTQQGLIKQETKMSRETGGRRHDAQPGMIREGGSQVPSLTPPRITGPKSSRRVNLPPGLGEINMVPVGTKPSSMPPEFQVDSIRPELAAKLLHANEPDITGLRIPSTRGLPDEIDDPPIRRMRAEKTDEPGFTKRGSLPKGGSSRGVNDFPENGGVFSTNDFPEQKFMKKRSAEIRAGSKPRQTEDELENTLLNTLVEPEQAPSKTIRGGRSYRGKDTRKISLYGRGATGTHSKAAKQQDAKSLAEFGIGKAPKVKTAPPAEVDAGKPVGKPKAAGKPNAKSKKRVAKAAGTSKGALAKANSRAKRAEAGSANRSTLKDVKRSGITKRVNKRIPSALDRYDPKDIDREKGVINVDLGRAAPPKGIPPSIKTTSRGIPIIKSRNDATFNYDFDYNEPGADPAPENQMSYVSPYRLSDKVEGLPWDSSIY